MKNRFPFKKFHLWLRHRTAEYCVRSFISLVQRPPPRLRVLIISSVARLTLAILWRYRKLMEQNVSMAMSDECLTVERRKTVVRLAWRNFVWGLYETAYALYTSRDAICASVAIEGQEHLKRAFDKGRGG